MARARAHDAVSDRNHCGVVSSYLHSTDGFYGDLFDAARAAAPASLMDVGEMRQNARDFNGIA